MVVEANARGNRDFAAWKLVHYEAVGGRDDAARRALHLARTYLPAYPRQVRSRLVFRQPDGALLVHLDGALSEWHLRISVAEFVGGFDGSGNPLP